MRTISHGIFFIPDDNKSVVDRSVEPKTAIYVIIAIFVALIVGRPLSAAVNSGAVIPLVSECPTLLSDNLSLAESLSPLILCSLGIMIFLAIPGTIGIALMIIRAR